MKYYIVRIALLVSAFAIIPLLGGCSTFNKVNAALPIPLATNPHDAGYNLVVFDGVMKPFIPSQYQTVIDSTFRMLTINYNQPDKLLDQYVKGQIDVLYKDSTPQFRDAMFNLYLLAKAKVKLQINANPNLPKLKTIEAFKQGVKDGLKIIESSQVGTQK